MRLFLRLMDVLEVSGVSKIQRDTTVLEDISFTQKKLQNIAIAGETGSGKTSLLKIIGGLMQPNSGTVLLDGKKVAGPMETLLPGHPKIAYLSQAFELRNNYRVSELLNIANKMSDEAAGKIYEICRISHLLNRKTDELSGGEKQRIATAMVLIKQPELLLLDEPFSNLDMHHKQIIKSVIYDIEHELKLSCMLISHDPADTLSWADDIIVLDKGKMVQHANPQTIYHAPVNEYVAALFGKYNILTLAQMQALYQVQGLEITGDNMLIRPEAITVSDVSDGKVKAILQSVKFYGAYYEVHLLLAEDVLTARMKECNFGENTEVYISLDANKIVYLK